MDTKSQRNLQKVTEDLVDIHRIMSNNVTEIINRGAKLSGLNSARCAIYSALLTRCVLTR
jgi:hypothetical protein